MSQTEQLSRWRLILGAETEESFSGMGGSPLSREELLMDAALGAIYGGPGESFGGSGGGGGKGPWGTCGPSSTRRRWRWCRTTPLSARG